MAVLLGYCDPLSAAAGEAVRFMVSCAGAARALGEEQMAALGGPTVPGALAPDVIGAWDFGRDIGSVRITDTGPRGLHGQTVNLPTRAVTGHNWDGTEMDWTRAPGQYGAIHFHDDDIYDAGWDADFILTVPPDMPSGVYAARLRTGRTTYHVPFFVRPPAAGARAKVAYLAATLTYMAYHNNASRFHGTLAEYSNGALTVLDAIDMLQLDHPELGLSTYDSHRDGSGVAYSSRLRPATNMRPTGRLWNFAADLFVVDWLERSGVPFDVVTDEDLDRLGGALLAPYRVLVTGSHPEYITTPMRAAIDGWLRAGGRMMYLGGNGFYWRAALHPEQPGVVELRRAEAGVRAWEARPGEYYHSFTGEHGGLWRQQGRAPNALCGVGFIGWSFDASSYYRRTDASRDPRAAFIFAGIEDEVLGDFGLLGGGAAGIEIDCTDPSQGTPGHALVLARSERHTPLYTMNEAVFLGTGLMDQAGRSLVRADMVFFEIAGGGAVFSTGSIAYAGSLGSNGFDNNIARLTGNVLARFADPAPFEMPAAEG